MLVLSGCLTTGLRRSCLARNDVLQGALVWDDGIVEVGNKMIWQRSEYYAEL